MPKQSEYYVSVCKEKEEFLKTIDFDQRMVDWHGEVCKFLQHPLCSSKLAVVEYADGSKDILRFGSEVDFYPFKFVPYFNGKRECRFGGDGFSSRLNFNFPFESP